MNTWQIKKLREVADILMGQSPPSNTYNVKGEGLPFFQGKADFNDVYPSVSKYCSKPVRIAQKDDILLSVRAPVGPVNLAPSEICIGRGLSAIRGKENILNQMYLFYFMRLNELALGKRGTGSTFTSINRRDIEKIDLPLPPLPTQHQIVERLDAIRKLQELNNKEIEKADELFESLLNQSFKPGRNWLNILLGELCSEVYRYPTYFGITYVERGIPEVRGEMLTDDGEINLNRTIWRYIDETTASKYPRTKLIQGDILISVRGTIGKLGYVPKELEGGNITANLIRLSPNPGLINHRYLFYFLKTEQFRRKLTSISHSTTIKTLKSPDLKATVVPVPDRKTQSVIVERLSTVLNWKTYLSLRSNKVSELFESTLNKAMKGELVN